MVENLTSRLRGSETVAVEVSLRDGSFDAPLVQRKLEQVAGVSRVMFRETRDGKGHFMVESLQGRHVRPELARAVVESGWNLIELHAVGLSLEEIFLQLTGSAGDEALRHEHEAHADVAEAMAPAEETK